jgi:tetratricopeptide (TPR) repeat protein
MSRPLAAALLVVLLPLQAAVRGQASPEPSLSDPPSTTNRQLWIDAAAIHQLKLPFVAALQRFLRAQAGTFGDEGDELERSVADMQAALTRWDGSIDAWQARVRRLPPTADAHVALATVFLDRHRPDDALRELAAAERIDDGRADIYSLRALAQESLPRPAQASRALARAAALDPDNPVPAYRLVRSVFQERVSNPESRPSSPESRALHRALQRRPARAPAPFERVDLLRQSDTAPIFPQALYQPGFVALSTGDYAGAVNRFAEAIPRDPLLGGAPESRAARARAAALLRQGDLASAITMLEQEVKATPADAESHRLLGFAYAVDEQQGRALEHLRTAITRTPADERAWVALADVLISAGRFPEAERELQRAGSAGVTSGQIRSRFAQIYQEQSLLPQASAELQAAGGFGVVAGRDRHYQMLGSLFVNQADFDGAISAYSRRVDVNPNRGEAHRQLAEIYFLQGRDDEALAEFAVAAWLAPDDARAHAGAGQVHAREQQHGEAIAAFQRALALDASLKEARYALATSLMRLGRADEGRREMALFQKLQAESDAAGQRAFALEALRREASRSLIGGATNRAIAIYTEALEADPGSAGSHRDLGLALLRGGRAAEAVDRLVRAQEIEETAEGALHLANALAAAGDRDGSAKQAARHAALVLDARRAKLLGLAGRLR